MIYWITGKRNSGKTTLAYKLREGLLNQGKSVLLLDGDEVRDNISDPGYDSDARRLHIMTIAGYAALAEKQGITVIISLVSPCAVVRNDARSLFQQSILIYVPGGDLWPGTTYDTPTREELYMNALP